MMLEVLARALMLLMLSCCGRHTATAAEPDAASEKASVAFRISTRQWMPAERFEELPDLFDRYPGVTDEITLFHSTTHAPLPLEEVRKRANVLTRRKAQARTDAQRAAESGKRAKSHPLFTSISFPTASSRGQ